jgi:hypothetical protein
VGLKPTDKVSLDSGLLLPGIRNVIPETIFLGAEPAYMELPPPIWESNFHDNRLLGVPVEHGGQILFKTFEGPFLVVEVTTNRQFIELCSNFR